MTRKEEIEKASVEYQLENKPMAIGGDAFADLIYKVNVNPSFVAGAEWADAHPVHYDGQAMLYVLQKGVKQGKKEMLDKTIEWLKEHFYDRKYEIRDDDGPWIDADVLLEDLKKAMEE